MNKIVIVADLGRVRVFRLEKDSLEDKARWCASELESSPLDEVPERIQDEVSDQAGGFARGNASGVPGGRSSGEEHNYQTEHEDRLIRGVAERISKIIDREKPNVWDLAAPQPICKRLQERLSSNAQECLKHVEGLDLTKETVKDIEKRFSPAG